MFIPWPTYIWALLSTAAVVYDFLYIYLRPETFRYHQYEWKFEPYQVYQFFDTLKINMENYFLIVQSWLSLVELAFLWIALILSLLPLKRVKYYAALMLIVVCACIFWKTVFYLCYDRKFITVSVQRFYTVAVVFYYLTIGQWLIWPLLTIHYTFQRITNAALLSKEKQS